MWHGARRLAADVARHAADADRLLVVGTGPPGFDHALDGDEQRELEVRVVLVADEEVAVAVRDEALRRLLGSADAHVRLIDATLVVVGAPEDRAAEDERAVRRTGREWQSAHGSPGRWYSLSGG